ncbi:AAA family ATPase [Amantichitinum ursilacus]|uniref:Bifunctional DNA-binding transcriptional repressor/ NMN adenylyltransferase n=1 Tax=Amantichitinum ursilacus TaxID=857265 RepID=A0A0N1JR64_9NEIS|nr:ATP-binding protein [Amantichitinum ursilacus]KPC49190.1 bifunctional DNA-binding transcriptional repressor/ NMN adenylyltransferase [Amantichitinum ursilacus]
MRKIAIVGPESSGKTTLAQDLAQRLACPWVAEYVREYFAARADASYDLQDIIEIARGQLAAEHAAPASTDLVCDTNGLVCKIWAEVRFGVCPPELATLWPAANYALHVLVRPDIPWEPDPLRENPTDRDWLFGLYATALDAAGVPWISVGGSRSERVDAVLAALQH